MSNYNEHRFYELHPTGKPNGAGRRPPSTKIDQRRTSSSAAISNLNFDEVDRIGTNAMVPTDESMRHNRSSRILMIGSDDMNAWRPAMAAHSWVNKAWNHASICIPEKSDLMQTSYRRGHLVAMIIAFNITIKDQGKTVHRVFRIVNNAQSYLAVTDQNQLVDCLNRIYAGVKDAQRTYADDNKLKKNQYLYQTTRVIYFYDDHSYDTEIGGFMEIARRFGKFNEDGQFILS